MLTFVYALFSPSHDKVYIGMTNDVHRRLKQHNSFVNKSTKAYAPWKLLCVEEYQTTIEARAREKYLKTYRGRLFIRKTYLKN